MLLAVFGLEGTLKILCERQDVVYEVVLMLVYYPGLYGIFSVISLLETCFFLLVNVKNSYKHSYNHTENISAQ